MKMKYVVISAVALLLLIAVALLQIFLYGNILPGPSEPERMINKPNAVSENPMKLGSGYYDTTWPSEHADQIRSHAVLSAGLPQDLDTSKLKLQVSSTELYMPTWGYTRGDNDIFVIGGSPQFMTTFTESIKEGEGLSKLKLLTYTAKDMWSSDVAYVAKINTETNTKSILELDKGSTVNYTGGLLMHANGYVYAVSQSVLYQIDPDQMVITKSVDLPKVGNSLTNYWTTYNGLQVLDNGELVLKGFHILNNANLDGYLLLIDPDTLQMDIKQKARVSSARLAIKDNDLYHVNAEEVLRFHITDQGFIRDDSYTATYRTQSDQSTQASSPMLLPGIDMLVFADNTAPGADTPMRLYTKSTKDGNGKLQSAHAFTTDKPSFNFFMVGGDTFVNNLVVYYDPLNNLVSANKIHDDGSISLLWEREGIKASASPAIAVESGQVYIDDYTNGKDHFVVLDLTSGEELGRVELPATLPTVGTIFVGENNDVFVLSSEAGQKTGYVSRITVAVESIFP